MFRLKLRFFFSFLSLLLIGPTATAGATETLVMDNGDRLSGHVLRMSDGVLELETGYAGTMRVNWKHVREILSDTNIKLRLAGNEVVSITSLKQDNGQVCFADRSEPVMKVMQINPADWETGKASKFGGEVDAAFKLERGNSQVNQTDVTSRLEWKKTRHRIRVAGELEYGKTDGEVSSDRWSVETSYDNTPSKRFYYGGRTSLKSDEMSDLNLRWSSGPHVGYRLADTDRTKFSAETGLEYTTEDYHAQSLDSFIGESWRIEFSHFLIPGKLELYHRDNGLVSLADFGALTLDTWTGIKLPIAGGVNTSAEFKTSYNGKAPAGAKLWDTIYRIKVGYQW